MIVWQKRVAEIKRERDKAVLGAQKLLAETIRQRDESIAEAYRRGDKIAAIAADFGMDNRTICQIAQKYGCPPRGKGKYERGN